MKKNKLIAWLILAIAYIIPFKYAFFLDLQPGKASVLGFLAVIIGTGIFAVLIYNSDKEKI